MTRHSRMAVVRAVVCFSCAILLVMLILGPLAVQSTGQVESSPAMKLTSLGLKFDGAQTCDGAKCHGKPGDDVPPTERGHEYKIWAAHDLHHEAYKTLGKDESKQIGAKMSPAIADVKTANACLSCHALNVDAKLKGDKFNINEGNTCGNCHGPSEKWMKPHAETEGWTQKMRDSMSHDALLKEWGLYDTKALAARATLCTSCHMAIDAEMVAAGHPQPTFELDYYQELENKHWLDPQTPYWASKVWLAGQVACVRDAMMQLSARAKAKKSPESIKSAAQQAIAHLGVLKAAGGAVGMDTAAMDATGADLAKAIADPGANADAIAAKADAAAKMADAALAKVDAVSPDKAMTMKALGAIAANDSLAKDCGRFGMDQQALAIDSLYKSWAFAEKTPEADRQAMVDLIETKLLPQDEGEPNVDEYMKVLAEVRGKLPK